MWICDTQSSSFSKPSFPRMTSLHSCAPLLSLLPQLPLYHKATPTYRPHLSSTPSIWSISPSAVFQLLCLLEHWVVQIQRKQIQQQGSWNFGTDGKTRCALSCLETLQPSASSQFRYTILNSFNISHPHKSHFSSSLSQSYTNQNCAINFSTRPESGWDLTYSLSVSRNWYVLAVGSLSRVHPTRHCLVSLAFWKDSSTLRNSSVYAASSTAPIFHPLFII